MDSSGAPLTSQHQPGTKKETEPGKNPSVKPIQRVVNQTDPKSSPVRPRAGRRRYWQDLIERNLKIKQGPVQERAPYLHFKKPKALGKFLGETVFARPDDLVSRERSALRLISEALEQSPPVGITVVGDLMKDKAVSLACGDNKHISDVLQAGVHRDVDIEDPDDRKGADGDDHQSVSAAAHSILSASPNCLGPPIDACVTYLQAKKGAEYGRNKMNTWISPFMPHLDGKEGRKALLDHQVTAIVWLLSRLFGQLPTLTTNETSEETKAREDLRGPRYYGGILADSMGLGKTLTIIGLLSIVLRKRLQTFRDAQGKVEHLPILLLAPNVTVAAQWVYELCKSTTSKEVKQIVVSGGSSDNYNKDDARVRFLNTEQFRKWPRSLKDMWDPRNISASKTILVVPIDTWSYRTCRCRKPQVDEECLTNDKDAQPQEWYSTFTEDNRRFSFVIVDEAYKVKNSETKLYRSVYLLQRHFTILITATPCMNTVVDLLALGRLLWCTVKSHIDSEKLEAWENTCPNVQMLESMLGQKESWHDHHILAGRPALLVHLLCKDRKGVGQEIQQIRRYLRWFETLAMLRRSPDSHIHYDWEKTRSVSLHGLYPESANNTIYINSNSDLALEYQKTHLDILLDYFEALEAMFLSKEIRLLRNPNEKDLKWFATVNRQFQIASASLDVYRLDTILLRNGFSTKAQDIATMRANGVTFVNIAPFLLEPHDHEPRKGLDYIKLAIRKSPVLGFILKYLRENVLQAERGKKIKKLLITEAIPILAYYYELALQLLQVNAHALHSDLNQDQRKELLDSFNSDDPSSCQVLIQMYTVGFAGSNLHHNCHQVIVASQAHSNAVQQQAVHRVIRVGQEYKVEVNRVMVNNTYHQFREARQVEKYLPELGARAVDNINEVLVQLLDLFQHEADEAWNSSKGRKLLETKCLLRQDQNMETNRGSNDISSTSSRLSATTVHTANTAGMAVDTPILSDLVATDTVLTTKKQDTDTLRGIGGNIVHPDGSSTAKGVLMETTTAQNDGENERKDDGDDQCEKGEDEDNQESDDDGETPTNSQPEPNIFERYDESDDSGSEAGFYPEYTLGWFNEGIRPEGHEDCFLSLKTRKEYYREFKHLPDQARTSFKHEKNLLRRLLSYHCAKGQETTRKFQVEDLDDDAILERSLESTLRIRLGAQNFSLMPYPYIKFHGMPEKQMKRLHQLIGKIRATDQDVEEARQDQDSRSKDSSRDMLKAINKSESLTQIEQRLDDEVRYGSTGGQRKPQWGKAKVKLEQESEIKAEDTGIEAKNPEPIFKTEATSNPLQELTDHGKLSDPNKRDPEPVVKPEATSNSLQELMDQGKLLDSTKRDPEPVFKAEATSQPLQELTDQGKLSDPNKRDPEPVFKPEATSNSLQELTDQGKLLDSTKRDPEPVFKAEATNKPLQELTDEAKLLHSTKRELDEVSQPESPNPKRIKHEPDEDSAMVHGACEISDTKTKPSDSVELGDILPHIPTPTPPMPHNNHLPQPSEIVTKDEDNKGGEKSDPEVLDTRDLLATNKDTKPDSDVELVEVRPLRLDVKLEQKKHLRSEDDDEVLITSVREVKRHRPVPPQAPLGGPDARSDKASPTHALLKLKSEEPEMTTIRQ